MTPTPVQHPAADKQRPPAPIATVLLLLLVLAATGAIAFFAFGGQAAAGDDTIRYEVPAAAGDAASVRRP